MKKVAIIQSNYIPWKGYFDIIHDVDLFVFYDDVQFTSRDWRTRNKIKTQSGSQWLTIPVGANRNRLICDVTLDDPSWQRKHYETLTLFYKKTPYFSSFKALLEHFYLEKKWDSLSALNQHLIETISKDSLGITTSFVDSRVFAAEGEKQARLLSVLKKAGATQYVSGPAARDYIIDSEFARVGIELVYKDYSGYPQYPQSHPPLDHYVTILDLLFHTGPDAPWYIWGWRDGLPKPDHS